MYAIVALLLLFSAVSSAEEQTPVTVTARVDKTSVNIGDKIKYSIEVKADKDVEIQFPSVGEDMGGLAIKDTGTLESGYWGSKTRTQWYILDSYQPGPYKIPPAIIKYKEKNKEDFREISADQITVEVLSALPEKDKPADIKDIRGPFSYYNMTYLYVLLAVLAVILIIVLVIFFLRKRNKSRPAETPPRPAHEIALEALKELMDRDLITSGHVHVFYVELSNIVRHYLENRFHLRAPEMTTEEFLSSLKHTETLSSEHKSLLREFMSHCDMVKFAKYRPEDREIESSCASARMLVEQTRESFEGVKKD